MNVQKLTQKSLEAIQNAQSVASTYGNQAVDQQHLVYALLTQQGGLIPQLLTKMEVDPENFKTAVTQSINAIPKVTMSGGRAADSVYVSNDLDRALADAESCAERMKDEYVSVEHLFLGMINQPGSEMKKLFKTFNITKDEFLQVLQTVRGSANVTTQNP